MWRNGRWDEARGETRMGVEGGGGQRSGGEGWGVRGEDIRAGEEVTGNRGEDLRG